MKKFFMKLSAFFRGRYGYDQLSYFMSFTGIVLMLLSMIKSLRILYAPALVLLILVMLRSFSKKYYKRKKELDKYLKLKGRLISTVKLSGNRIRERKTHRYLRCPSCHATIRIRRPEKGKTITVTCPKCCCRFDKRT